MPRLLRGIARTAVIAGTATAVSNGVSRRQAGRWAEQEQRAAFYAAPPADPVAAPSPVTPAAAPPSINERLVQLNQLAALKDQGVLTDAEFAAEKARILAS